MASQANLDATVTRGVVLPPPIEMELYLDRTYPSQSRLRHESLKHLVLASFAVLRKNEWAGMGIRREGIE